MKWYVRLGKHRNLRADEPLSYADMDFLNTLLKQVECCRCSAGLEDRWERKKNWRKRSSSSDRSEMDSLWKQNVEKHEDSSDAYVDRGLTFVRINAPKLSRYLETDSMCVTAGRIM